MSSQLGHWVQGTQRGEHVPIKIKIRGGECKHPTKTIAFKQKIRWGDARSIVYLNKKSFQRGGRGFLKKDILENTLLELGIKGR